MARRTWLGISGSLRLGREERQGLVLSGGGSKASFQLGALSYLYEVVGIQPQVVVGTSAGSILGAMLAQSADREGQMAALRDLDSLWLDMTQQSDMFTERTWFSRFRSRSQDLMEILNRDARGGWLGGGLSRIQLPFGRQEAPVPPVEPASPVEAQEELSGQMETLAMATLDPTSEGPELSPSQVMAILAGLSRMRGVGSDLGVIMSGAEKTRSMYIPGPLLRALLGESGLFDSSKVHASGMTVRIAMVSLESGELCFMREDGRLVDRDDVELPGEAHDFSRGVLASCSIPTVFTPVPMDGEHFVDGGVRENLPAEMAIGSLGCTTTYVVTSNAPGVRASGSFEDKDMFQILLRSTEIASDETERDEVAYAKLAGAVVIEPEFDVHEALVVDPGLIRINRDYGWIRAAEQHLGATAAEQALGRSIITARRRIWELEKDYLDPAIPHDERELLLLARLKYDLRDQVPRLRPGLLPGGAEQWWQRWEAHPVAPQVDPPWLI